MPDTGAEIDTARDTILPTGELRGRLRVAMPLWFGPTHFAPVLADMAQRHPQLHVHAAYSDRFVDLIAVVTVQPQGRFKADNATALAAAAAAGLGIAWLPDCITHDYVASGALVAVMTRYPPPPAGAYLVRPPGKHPTRKVRVLLDMLIENFARNPNVWVSSVRCGESLLKNCVRCRSPASR